MIELQPITSRNWEEAIQLDVFPEQRNFVPSVAISLAKAYIKPDGVNYDPIGVFSLKEEQLVGFYSYMYRHHDLRVVYISGFLIDHRFQRAGYGAATMTEFLSRAQAGIPECEGVYLTVHPENVAAEKFYSRFGFVKTGLVIDGEDAMGKTFQNRVEQAG